MHLFKVVCISMYISFLFMGSWLCECIAYLCLFINLFDFYLHFCLALIFHFKNCTISVYILSNRWIYILLIRTNTHEHCKSREVKVLFEVQPQSKLLALFYWCNRCCYCLPPHNGEKKNCFFFSRFSTKMVLASQIDE